MTSSRTIRRAIVEILIMVSLISLAVPIDTAGASSPPPPPSLPPNTLSVGQKLVPASPMSAETPNEIISHNGWYGFGLYTAPYCPDGSLNATSVDVLVGHVVTGESWDVCRGNLSDPYLTLQSDGNLVFYAANRPIWASNTVGSGRDNHVVAQDDGNVVMYTASGKPVWATGTGRVALGINESLSPGQRLLILKDAVWGPTTTLTMQRDGDLVLDAGGVDVWASNTSVPGSTVTLQSDGNLVITGRGREQWSSRTSGYTGLQPILEILAGGRFKISVDSRSNHGVSTESYESWTQRGERGLPTSQESMTLMTAGSTLLPGHYLLSDTGYRLTMQPDGNLVARAPSGRALWQSHTAGLQGTRLVLQADGNLVLYQRGRARWSSHTATNSGPRISQTLRVQNDGNVVARDRANRVTWSTRT